MDEMLSCMTLNVMLLDAIVSPTQMVSRDIYTCDMHIMHIMHIMRRLSNSNLVSSGRLVFRN